MSNALAIAAVTTTLRNLLARGTGDELGSGSVTTMPPDKARSSGDATSQLNLFLYHLLPSASWRNQDLPNRTRPGEIGLPPLPLHLYYLLTAYGKDDDDIAGHRLLGKAMRILHDHSVLDPAEIRLAMAESDLHQQIERVRITLQPLSLDEVSKLWSSFQTQYRISATYEVSVVLIESSRPVRAALPVLTRGANDQGVIVQPSLTSPFPLLTAVLPPNQQPSVRLGELLTLQGNHLESDDGQAIVRFSNSRLPDPIELQVPTGRSPVELTVTIPNQPTVWVAGSYTVAVTVKRAGKVQTTNALPFTIAPRIQRLSRGLNRDLTLTCNPQILTDQTVALFLGSRELLPQPLEETAPLPQRETLVFDGEEIPAGEYFVRLRVDGVDSLLINRAVNPPTFDASQRVQL